MKTLKKQKLTTLFAACFAVPCIGMAAAIVNPADIYDIDWSSETLPSTSWSTNTATGGVAPSISGGNLVLDNTGATGGVTWIAPNVTAATLNTEIPNDFVYTVRASVTQFPDTLSTARQIMLAFGRLGNGGTKNTILSIYIRSDAILIANNATNTTVSVATAENTFYTWQFQVSTVASNTTEANGTMDIYRRASDGDAWTTLATGVTVGSSNTPPTSSFFRFGNFDDNDLGAQVQGILNVEYTQLGTIPEPSSVLLLTLGAGLALCRRNRRHA